MQAELLDIRDLDPIGWWPPAAGWWISATVLLLLLFLLVLWIRHLIHYPPGSWRKEADHALRQLRRRQQGQPAKETASQLSELLRRIAMARFGRQRQASLSGDDWLLWLQQSDPNRFDWPGRGKWLLSLPYAPERQSVDGAQLRELIEAALRLVSSSRKDPRPRRRRWWGRRHV